MRELDNSRRISTSTGNRETEKLRETERLRDIYRGYSSIARTIILDLPYYWSFKPAAYHVAKRFYLNNFNLTDLRVPKSVVEVQQVLHRQRLLSLKCDNCLYTDVQEVYRTVFGDSKNFRDSLTKMATTICIIRKTTGRIQETGTI